MYKTKEEFKAYLDLAYKGIIEPSAKKPDQKYRDDLLKNIRSHQLTEKNKNRLEIGISQLLNSNPADFILKSLINSYISKLDFYKEHNEKFLITWVKNNLINASIIKGENGFFGIVFYTGFFLYISKATKYILASIDPKSVTYCELTDDIESIGSDAFMMWYKMMKMNYDLKKIVWGPKISLSPLMMAKRASVISFSETFIICHEIAHFLNGDFETKTNKISDDIDELIEGQNHEMEYKADSKGFKLLLEIIAKTKLAKEEQVLSYMLITFDLLGILVPEASKTHPSIYDRVINIVQQFYDENTLSKVKESYNELGFFDTNKTAFIVKPNYRYGA